MRCLPDPINLSPKTQGELLEAVKMLSGAIDGFPDVLAEPSINACYQKASALLDQVHTEMLVGDRLCDFPSPKHGHDKAR